MTMNTQTELLLNNLDLFFDEPTPPVIEVPTPSSFKTPYNSFFTGESILVNGQFDSTILSQGKTHIRTTSIGDKVDTYRNLNRTDLFSMKQKSGTDKDKVSGYAECIVMTDFKFTIGEKSRQRVVLNKTRNVHSFVRGELVDARRGGIDLSKLNDYLRVSYSPYVGGFFYTLERDEQGNLIEDSIKPIDDYSQYKFAVICGADVILTNLV